MTQTPSKHPHGDESCSVPDHQHLTERAAHNDPVSIVDRLGMPTGVENVEVAFPRSRELASLRD